MSYRTALLAGLKPDKIYNLSDWADEFRILSTKSSAEAGRWRTARVPYMREIMNCLSADSPINEVVVKKGAQIGAPLDIDTPLLTTAGWKTIGTVCVGDFVFGSDGKPCEVLFKSDVFKDRQCYELEFSDGARLVADSEHRWSVQVRSAKEATKVLTTEVMSKNFRLKRAKRTNNYSIFVSQPLFYQHREYKVHPYALGVYLGDGHAYSGQITAHKSDLEIARHLENCGYHVEVRANDPKCPNNRNLLLDGFKRHTEFFCKRGHDFKIKGKTKRGVCKECLLQRTRHYKEPLFHRVDPIVNHRKTFFKDLLSIDVIKNKHIPEEYFTGSIEQRLNLLQGLMDTDGTCTKLGFSQFYSSEKCLADGVMRLCLSLGLKPTMSEKKPCVKPTDKISSKKLMYVVSFIAYRETPVFKLSRKYLRQKDKNDPKCRPTKAASRKIIDIRPVKSRPVACIGVASKDHLFLAGEHLILTHNTEVGNCWLGYIIDHAPSPTLAVQPTVDLVRKFSKQRLEPLIEETPHLLAKVGEKKTKDSDNTIFSKSFPGGMIMLSGANSASSLRSMPMRNLFLDEIDAYPGDVDGEGDPVKLAEARQRTFAKRKTFKISTPTDAAVSRIMREYDDSDRRKYFVPCPLCDHMQTLAFGNLHWEEGRPDTVYYKCEGCAGQLHNWQKTKMLRAGEWRATNAEHANKKKAGFFINSLYSPVGWFGWHDIAREYEEALADTSKKKMKVFTNTILGMEWAEESETPDHHRLYERREQYAIGTVPEPVKFLTAGIDVQNDRVEIEVVGWGYGKESWSVDYQILHGDTSKPDVWAKLTEALGQTFPKDDKSRLSIQMACIDTGFNTQVVYNWCRANSHLSNVTPIKGRDGLAVAVAQPKFVDVKKSGRTIRRGIKLWSVGVSILKAELYGLLRLNRSETPGPQPGFCHFPEYSMEYFQQLTAERLIVKNNRRGYSNQEWQKHRERNEALDARCYARAAAAILGIDRFRNEHYDMLLSRQQYQVIPKSTDTTSSNTFGNTEKQKRPPVKRRSSGWL